MEYSIIFYTDELRIEAAIASETIRMVSRIEILFIGLS